MKKIIYLFVTLFSFTFLQNCEDTYVPDAAAYVTFAKLAYSTGVDPGGSTIVDITVFTADIAGADRSFDLTADGTGAAAGSYSVPSSVTIPAGSNEGTISVSLSDVDLGIGVNKVIIGFAHEDGFSNSAATTISYIQNCTEVTATLDLSFDRYGSEVYWEILDALDGVVAATAGYPDTGSGTTTTDSVTITLCAGRTYTFFAADTYGDSWGAGSSYTLTIGGVVKVSGDGSILDQAGVSTAFDTN